MAIDAAAVAIGLTRPHFILERAQDKQGCLSMGISRPSSTSDAAVFTLGFTRRRIVAGIVYSKQIDFIHNIFMTSHAKLRLLMPP